MGNDRSPKRDHPDGSRRRRYATMGWGLRRVGVLPEMLLEGAFWKQITHRADRPQVHDHVLWARAARPSHAAESSPGGCFFGPWFSPWPI